MRPRVKKATKRAERLYDADAGWVSLVPGGANETPFLVVKRKNGDSVMHIKSRNKKSHKKVDTGSGKSTAKKVDVVLAKMVFDGDLFEDKESVENYIKQAEWDAEGITIEKDDNGDWVAREGDYEDGDYIELSKVDTEDEGVVAFIGTRKSAAVKSDGEDDNQDADTASGVIASEDDDEDEADADDASEGVEASADSSEEKPKKKPMKSEKAESKPNGRSAFLQKRAEQRESVSKFNLWDAAVSKATVLGKAIKAGMEYDTTPPGYYDLSYTYNTVVASILGDDELSDADRNDLVRKAASEFADITIALDAVFTEYTNADAATVAKSIGDEKEREALAKWAEGYADFLVTKAEAQPSPKKERADKSEKSEKHAESNQTIVADLVAKAVAEAVDPIRDTLQSTASLVEKIASRKPTKKAHDVDSSAGSGKVQKTEADAMDDFSAAFL